MVVIMIVIMMVMVMIVIMVMVMVIMIVVVLVVGVMSYVGGHDTRQADRVMGMVVAVSGLCRGRSREESDCAEAGYRGSSKTSVLLYMAVPSEKHCRNVLGQTMFPAD